MQGHGRRPAWSSKAGCWLHACNLCGATPNCGEVCASRGCAMPAEDLKCSLKKYMHLCKDARARAGVREVPAGGPGRGRVRGALRAHAHAVPHARAQAAGRTADAVRGSRRRRLIGSLTPSCVWGPCISTPRCQCGRQLPPARLGCMGASAKRTASCDCEGGAMQCAVVTGYSVRWQDSHVHVINCVGPLTE